MRRLRADLAEVYKIPRGVDNRNFGGFFQLCNNNNRGHTFKLYLIRNHKNVRKHFFCIIYGVIEVWNSLTDDVVCAINIDIFKSKLLRINFNRYLVVRDHVV